MSVVLWDTSVSSLIQALESNLYSFTPFSQKLPGFEVHTDSKLLWCISDIPSTLCNVVFRANLEEAEIDTTIAGLVTKAREKNVSLLWLVGKDTKPGDLGEYLQGRGFVHIGDGPVMAIDLPDMHENDSAISAFTISSVRHIKDLEIWCHIISICYEYPEGREQALLEWCTRDLASRPTVKFYLGWFKGEPVATSLLFLDEGVAGIYFVATIPEARQQGIGFSITQRPLQEARDMSYRVGTLQASKMAKSIYLRMGFKEYGRIGSYIISPGKQV